jgi:hypothetical protein
MECRSREDASEQGKNYPVGLPEKAHRFPHSINLKRAQEVKYVLLLPRS